MRRIVLRKFTSSLVAVLHLVFSVLVVMPSLSHAQAVDVEPPTIDLEVVNEGVLGETQVFSATVADNNELLSMTLHYRLGTEGSYQSVPMSAIAGTSIYTASVDTANASSSIIQYYMEARDTGGNRTVQGFAFDPFERTLVEESPAIVADSSTTVPAVVPVTSQPMSNRKKILYGVLGVLIVGGIASSVGGSSGGGSPAPAGDVELTILVDRFQ